MDVEAGIDQLVSPSGEGCVECDATGSWWVHLRRCAACGHVGCCDDSLNKHATAHYHQTGHPIMQSFEPGEDWFWSFPLDQMLTGPELASPTSHPDAQGVPGPLGRVPSNWSSILFAGRQA